MTAMPPVPAAPPVAALTNKDEALRYSRAFATGLQRLVKERRIDRLLKQVEESAPFVIEKIDEALS